MKRERIIKRANPKSTYPTLKDGSLKVHNWRVRYTPTDTFPDLVTISNKVLEISKRFVTLDKAVKWIEGKQSERLVYTSGKRVQKELKTIGMGELTQRMEFANVEKFSYIDDNQRQDVDDPAFWS
jgi:hypothetical protein